MSGSGHNACQRMAARAVRLGLYIEWFERTHSPNRPDLSTETREHYAKFMISINNDLKALKEQVALLRKD